MVFLLVYVRVLLEWPWDFKIATVDVKFGGFEPRKLCNLVCCGCSDSQAGSKNSSKHDDE